MARLCKLSCSESSSVNSSNFGSLARIAKSNSSLFFSVICSETLVIASGWKVYFLRNSLPVQSWISFASVTSTVKQTLRAAPAEWKCPPLTCTALAQCSGQVWNYALANKWHPAHSPLTGEFPAQMTSNAENVSIGWRHDITLYWGILPTNIYSHTYVYICLSVSQIIHLSIYDPIMDPPILLQAQYTKQDNDSIIPKLILSMGVVPMSKRCHH